jgi:hypothetical protein
VLNEHTAASRWRIEFAREVIQFYVPREGISMVVLGGSPPKGLSDDFSDLDIIVYWDEIDVAWLEQDPLEGIQCERKYMRRMGEQDIYLESQYFGELKVDLGHLTMGVWKEMVDNVLERLDTDPSNLGALAGFMSSIPLYGDALVKEWKERIAPYPDELAVKLVRQHRRFFVPGYLKNQALGRGDLLAYYDGLCAMLKNILNILAALNRIYFSAEEPRWIEYSLDRMPIRPHDAWNRMRAVLTTEGEEAVGILDGLIMDVLALIDEHMPQIDGDYRERWQGMRVRAAPVRPRIAPAPQGSP